MTSDDDGPSCEPDPAKMAELLTDIGRQPIPPRLGELAAQLAKALEDARLRRQRGH